MSISTVTSEALQLKLRQLLPSQQGFGTDLSASDTIIPVIDLTQAAEGSDVPQFLQTAWDFGTDHDTIPVSTTTTLISTTGFWKIDLNYSSDTGAAAKSASVFIDDGASTKVVWETNLPITGATGVFLVQQGTFYVFLRAGDTLKATNGSPSSAFLDIWYRQVADINGSLVNPTGFSPS